MGVVQHPGLREVGLSPAATVVAGRRRAVCVSWERHRRTRELCRALDLELFELTSGAPRLLRYPLLLAQTTVRLGRARPDVVFIQCPSVLLGLWAGILRLAFGFTLVADLHNEAVEPFNYSFRAYRWLLGWIARQADVCLVTNEPLKDVVERRGGTAFVLPDKVPDLDARRSAEAGGARYVVFVCSFVGLPDGCGV